ncbi:NADH-quinone oxidoreductase subunit NuoG [Candidatus Kinetoplastidibacterium galati]|uniref:NADH-quinone oxidoreductase n=1 Tax=Candidatus Kinetoplastidibacterium galati TCC219 TaxID=1208921 RepID=M1LYQ7_9PROT|nr:NADH-quinone oxidoreductase subunit NuoG [Candidatus Kinetoplastibacterium galatii]AGF49201.1 NADH dehydrogenase I subunit G [Candidatus Kinetoplastibacterium galatii TCC219]
MVDIIVDGKKVSVPKGSKLIQATQSVGCYVPHFCYHKKLSIAANCRMCLVEVEKAPKALPACSTVVTDGMVVHTNSKKVKDAQKSVMEFLLINHPLDCPVCDKGGECQLQDLAVGYGSSHSRYKEEKRVVFQKNLGPLISASEMSRCIHCTRCVRFGEEIAGVVELGMINRGEKSEITSFLGRSIESELSGNMIDICPVGALTSKPFRFSARNWELARRKSISPHDSLGTNLIIQVKRDKVMRVVPFEVENINECWISDRDRFSYDGLNSNDRLSAPMIKDDSGNWHEISWQDALVKVSKELIRIKESYGAHEIGALTSEYSTLEEYFLFGEMLRMLGSNNTDFRLRQTDFNFDNSLDGIPWLGLSMKEIEELDVVVIIGSFLRKDHPLLAQRFRQISKNGSKIFIIDSYASDQLMNVSGRISVKPSEITFTIAKLYVAISRIQGKKIPEEFIGLKDYIIDNEIENIANSLVCSGKHAIFLGNTTVSMPDASTAFANSYGVSRLVGAKLGFLTFGANALGGYLAGFIPKNGGKNVLQMFEKPLKSYLIMHFDPLLDTDNGPLSMKSLSEAEFNVAFVSYASQAMKWADLMLPISPFTETSGSFINSQGIFQSFKSVVPPLGLTRPAWKVIGELSSLLGFPVLKHKDFDSLKNSILDENFNNRLSNSTNSSLGLGNPKQSFERLADIPIYRSDCIVRHSIPLQETSSSKEPFLRMNTRSMSLLSLNENEEVMVSSNSGKLKIKILIDNCVPDGVLHISAGFESTSSLGSSFCTLNVERL